MIDKTGKLLFIMAEMRAGLAYCAVRQDPYMDPPELFFISEEWDRLIRNDFKVIQPEGDPKMWMGEFSFEELEELVERLHLIPKFKVWNMSRYERAAGVKVDDPSRAPFVFSSRYGGPPREHDIIDLDALTGNLVRFLWAKARAEKEDGERIHEEVRQDRTST